MLQSSHPGVPPCYIEIPMIMDISMFFFMGIPMYGLACVHMEIPMKKTWIFP